MFEKIAALSPGNAAPGISVSSIATVCVGITTGSSPATEDVMALARVQYRNHSSTVQFAAPLGERWKARIRSTSIPAPHTATFMFRSTWTMGPRSYRYACSVRSGESQKYIRLCGDDTSSTKFIGPSS
jgi:hypothetical protein